MNPKTFVYAYEVNGVRRELEIEAWDRGVAEVDARNWLRRWAGGAPGRLIRVTR